MHDGWVAVALNGRGNIDDESRRYFCFPASAITFGLFHYLPPQLFSYFNY
jgi:hypothetical protein